jgi:hypothetical protein
VRLTFTSSELNDKQLAFVVAAFVL